MSAVSDCLKKMLNQSTEVGSLDVSANVLRVGLLTVREAALKKTGHSLMAT